MKTTTSPIRDAAIRLTMMPRDTNAHGTVFGGIILSYIDVAGGVEAVRQTQTQSLRNRCDERSYLSRTGLHRRSRQLLRRDDKGRKTSITIHVDVEAERFGTPGELVKVTSAEVTFVAIGENREKIVIGQR